MQGPLFSTENGGGGDGDPRYPFSRTWHLDKRVPIAVITALIFQTLGLGFWVGTITSRLDNVELWITDNRKIDTRLSVVETQLSLVNSSLSRIEAAIDVRTMKP